MKIFISSDIEGTTGITNWDETELNKPENSYFLKQMTKEVAAACEGAVAAGAQKVLVKDAHDSARNINPEALPELVTIMRGWSGDVYCMMSGIDTDTFDVVLFTGYHSGASSDGNPLSHTMNTQNEYVTVNGEKLSEFMLNAYIAGYFGVPVCFISGDKALCESAKKLIPGITAVAVNEGKGGATISIHPNLAVKKIREGVQAALQGDYRSCKVTLPEEFTVEIHFKKHADAYKKGSYPGAELIDTKTVRFFCTDFMDLLRFIHFVL